MVLSPEVKEKFASAIKTAVGINDCDRQDTRGIEEFKTLAIVRALEGLAITIAESRVPAVSPGFTLCRRFDENGNYIDEYYPIITAKIDGNIG